MSRSAPQRKIIGRVISVVFQDPATALNARMTVREQLMDPMIVHKVGDAKSREARVRELIEITQAEGEAQRRDGVKMTAAEREREIAKLEKEMRAAAKQMEYEYAAVLRDRIIELRGQKS